MIHLQYKPGTETTAAIVLSCLVSLVAFCFPVHAGEQQKNQTIQQNSDCTGQISLETWEKAKDTSTVSDSSETTLSEWVYDDGHWFLFSPDGVLQTGWYQEKGVWYYLHSDGQMHTGWLKLDGNWYYFDQEGHMLCSQFISLDDTVYCFDARGRMVFDQEIQASNGSATAYFDQTGACRSILPYTDTWQGTYMNAVEDFRDHTASRNRMEFCIIAGSSHIVPWLWMSTGPGTRGNGFLTAWNGSEASSIPTSQEGFRYASRRNIIDVSTARQDHTCHFLYSFTSGIWVQAGKGECTENQNGLICTWNGEKITEQGYRNKLSQLMPDPVQIQYGQVSTVSYSQILAWLLNV